MTRTLTLSNPKIIRIKIILATLWGNQEKKKTDRAIERRNAAAKTRFAKDKIYRTSSVLSPMHPKQMGQGVPDSFNGICRHIPTQRCRLFDSMTEDMSNAVARMHVITSAYPRLLVLPALGGDCFCDGPKPLRAAEISHPLIRPPPPWLHFPHRLDSGAPCFCIPSRSSYFC